MALLSVTILRDEAGVHYENPAESSPFNTHCADGPSAEKKTFKEVILTWHEGDEEWQELATVPTPDEEVVFLIALRIDNPCDGSFAYIMTPYNDFRLAQLCCPGYCEPSVINYEVQESEVGLLMVITVNGEQMLLYEDTEGTSGQIVVNQGDDVEIQIEGLGGSFQLDLDGDPIEAPFTVEGCGLVYNALLYQAPE